MEQSKVSWNGKKRWINKNSKVWTNAIKPGETVFSTNRTNQLYGSTNLIDELDIRRWKNIVGDDTDKLWLVIKRKMKEKVRLFQVHRWRLSKEKL